jgi:hypothetical protein
MGYNSNVVYLGREKISYKSRDTISENTKLYSISLKQTPNLYTIQDDSPII